MKLRISTFYKHTDYPSTGKMLPSFMFQMFSLSDRIRWHPLHLGSRKSNILCSRLPKVKWKFWSRITPLFITLTMFKWIEKYVFLMQHAFKTYFKSSENEHSYSFTVLENSVQPVLCASNSLPLRRWAVMYQFWAILFWAVLCSE